MKITYTLRNDLRTSTDYNSAAALIKSYRASYGVETSDLITIISVEAITEADKARLVSVNDSKAEYFKKFGTACE